MYLYTDISTETDKDDDAYTSHSCSSVVIVYVVHRFDLRMKLQGEYKKVASLDFC